MLAPGRQNHAASYYRRPSPVRSSHGFVEVVNKEAHYSQLLSDTEVALQMQGFFLQVALTKHLGVYKGLSPFPLSATPADIPALDPQGIWSSQQSPQTSHSQQWPGLWHDSHVRMLTLQLWSCLWPPLWLKNRSMVDTQVSGPRISSKALRGYQTK